MSKDMLGIAVRKLVTLQDQVLGVVCDLLEKLSDPEWVEATKRFLRRENPWPKIELLKLVREVTVNGVKKFVARDAFGEENPDGIKFNLWDNFSNNFLGKIEGNIKSATIAVHCLEKPFRDQDIMAKLGIDAKSKNGVIKLAHFREMLKAQAQGQAGPLLVNGYANIAYIEDENGKVWAVNANWNSINREWNVNANSVENPNGWGAGDQVLSKISLFKSPFYGVFVCFCQPPSIRPISSSFSDNVIYFLLSSIFISHIICSMNLKISSESDALFRYICFSPFGLRLAIKMFWIVSINRSSTFAPRPNFVNLSK